ncbi:glycosyltransferase family 2 protein [Faecalibaculum rodentium]|uniref:glycosyltransferase family 2 protein n=1 Tax=Faecalibaculum rodentium TaxID=1702221 RepID=UPI0023F1039E|nr:glycosyltransferase family 2 protein [Faecalibaculum rodentium]
MKKILTIVIPSYNVEKTLSETLASLMVDSVIENLDIIIVNDGSTDNTIKVATKYKLMNPNSIRIIDKPNGGHGSTINCGIHLSKTKYFKVVDGDDCLEKDALIDLVNYLKECDDDIVFNPYYLWDIRDDYKSIVDYSKNKYLENKSYSFKEVSKDIDIPMHSMTIKTSILKTIPKIDEHCFYVDVEYVLYPIISVSSISFRRKPLYKYRFFVETQSMSQQQMQKNISHHRTVIDSLISFYQLHKKDMQVTVKEYYERRVAELIKTNITTLYSFEPTKERLDDLISLLNFVDSQAPSILQKTKTGKYIPVIIFPKLTYKIATLYLKLKRYKQKIYSKKF